MNTIFICKIMYLNFKNAKKTQFKRIICLSMYVIL